MKNNHQMGWTIQELKDAKWSIRIYNKTDIEKQTISEPFIQVTKGFSAFFSKKVSANFIEYDRGSYRISFNLNGEHTSIWYPSRKAYLEYCGFVFIVKAIKKKKK